MACKNSELQDWLSSIGINLCDVVKDGELIEQVAVEFCKQAGLDPNESVELAVVSQDGKPGITHSLRSTLYEPQARAFLLMLRSLLVVLSQRSNEPANG